MILSMEIPVEDIVQRQDLCYIDLRSPGEHRQASIPGSFNIPLFNDREREELGVIYHNQGSFPARMRGLEIGSRKLPELAGDILSVSRDKLPLLYCWRGGLRSEAVYENLKMAGINCLRLQGGYRSFRRFINRTLQNYHIRPRLVVLHGLTGTGKTLLLNVMASRYQPVLDLEGLACHRGSVFGKIGIKRERSQKDFEAMLWWQLENMQKSPFILVEGEGRRIGNLFLPDFLRQAMQEGIHLLVTAPLEVRAGRIALEYTSNPLSGEEKEQFYRAIKLLSRKLGKEKTEYLLECIKREDYFEAALYLCKEYYDHYYEDARPGKQFFEETIDATCLEEGASQLARFLDYYFHHNKPCCQKEVV